MLGETLKTILETSADASEAKGPTVSLLREVWTTLVGEPMCHRTRPDGWDDGTLRVSVASQHWLAEARRHRRHLHRRIASRLPWKLESITFSVGDLPAPSAHELPAGEQSEASAEPVQTPADDALADDAGALDDKTRLLAQRIRAHIQRES